MRLLTPLAPLVAPLVALLSLVLAACGRSEVVEPAPTAAGDPRAGWPAVVRVGLVPSEGGADTRARFVPLRDRLRESLGVDVELVTTSNYQGVVTAMAADQLEFAWFGPKSYIAAAERAGAEALVLNLNPDGEPGYRAVFVVPAQSPIVDLPSARGARFAFTDPVSTSGYLIPAVIINDEMGEPADKFFGQVVFSGGHQTSLLQVAAGEIDVVASNTGDMMKMIETGTIAGDAVRVIHTSDLIPGEPFACRRELPQSLKDAFTLALLAMNGDPDLLERLQIGGYVRTTDATYDIIRSVERYHATLAGSPTPDD